MQDTDQPETSARRTFRWQFNDPALLYLFPASYVIHLAEEAFVRAPLLLWTIRLHQPVATWPFIIGNASGLVLMVFGIRLVHRSSVFNWVVPALATAVLSNTLGHLVGSFSGRTYSAGLMSAAVLWVPLGLLTLLRAWDQVSTRMLTVGLLVGVLIEAIVAMFSTLSNLLNHRPV